jgi:hypothetical protein
MTLWDIGLQDEPLTDYVVFCVCGLFRRDSHVCII